MTRDAKIGLLLGLVFIFMIAFIINGLPGVRSDGNELTNNMANFPNNPPLLGVREREVINWADGMTQRERAQDFPPPIGDPRIRDRRTLPVIPVIENEGDKVAPIAPRPVEDQKPPVRKRETVRAMPKIYSVAEGDSLASIAKKFYGPEEGNKQANIMKIFKANRKILESPDDIYVGQKLVIPPLSASGAIKDKSKGIFSSDIFQKVVSIGREHLTSKGRLEVQGRTYTVKDGDSLWRIAAEKLGDGNRYKEIVKLNAAALEDEDTVNVGMSLKLPAR